MPRSRRQPPNPPVSDVVRCAVDFSVAAYENAGSPARCIDHVLLVGRLLAENGCSDAVVAAGLLQAVVGDHCASVADVGARFGEEIGGIVAVVTEDQSIENGAARKASRRNAVRSGGLRTELIFAADRVARLRAADRRAEPIDAKQLEYYGRSLRMLTTSGHRLALVDEFRILLDRRLPHGAGGRLTGALE